MDNIVINNLLNNCWHDTTGIIIEPTNFDELTNHEDLFIASIVFTGDENGSLSIAMSERMAKIIAKNMFGESIDSISFDDIKDCIGELSNVIAGNLKTDFFCENKLSKPVVTQGNDSMISIFIRQTSSFQVQKQPVKLLT